MMSNGQAMLVRFTGKGKKEVDELAEWLDMPKSQAVRLGVHRFYQFMKAVYEEERENARRIATHRLPPPC